ncbi:MAG: VOC family protein [Chloroflexi bacterium]|nr:VOC family protein [Acidobacteriota bacterium]MCA1587955.1 VOC family protein [Chloroflexota bacterium]MCA1719566.1 VOC family protein [Actinomycetota bacterium]
MTIRGANKVVVGVQDQERAKRFWADVIGFTVTTDAPYGDDGRWVEVTSPDGNLTLILSADPEMRYQFAIRDEVPNANPFFYADDIEQTYEELSARGVEFAVKPSQQPWGWWSMFVDTEGNRFALQQREES